MASTVSSFSNLITGTGLSDNATKIITSIITTLVWPLVVIILAIIFRESIADLISRLKNVEVAGVKTEFGDFTQIAADTAETIKVTPDPATSALIQLAANEPWSAVHQAWLLIQSTAREAVNGRVKDGNTTPERVRMLTTQEFTDENVYQLAKLLSSLHKEMGKAPSQITPAAATNYVESAAKLVAVLSAAKTAQPDPH